MVFWNDHGVIDSVVSAVWARFPPRAKKSAFEAPTFGGPDMAREKEDYTLCKIFW